MTVNCNNYSPLHLSFVAGNCYIDLQFTYLFTEIHFILIDVVPTISNFTTTCQLTLIRVEFSQTVSVRFAMLLRAS